MSEVFEPVAGEYITSRISVQQMLRTSPKLQVFLNDNIKCEELPDEFR
jgi:hypothetical protein